MAKSSVQTFGEWVESNAPAPVFGSKTAVRKWLLGQLAERRITVTENTIRNCEEGRYFPRPRLLDALMAVTGLPMEAFRAWRQIERQPPKTDEAA